MSPLLTDLPLLGRKLLFGNPDRTGVTISPDGSKLAYLAPVDGVLNVWVAPADNPAAARPVTKDTRRGIRQYLWTYTGEHVIYLQDRDGDENWHAYLANVTTAEHTDLTPIEGARAQIEAVSHLHPESVLIGLNDRDARYHDLYRVDLATGERSLVFANEGFAVLVTDDDYRIRMAVNVRQDASVEWHKPGAGGEMECFARVEPDDTMTTVPIATDAEGDVVYLLDSRGRDMSALVALRLADGHTTLIAESDLSDIGHVLIHPTTRAVQAYRTCRERARWHAVDPALEADLRHLRALCDGDFHIVGRTLADDLWIVAYDVDDGPVRFYLYDRGAREARYLFSNRAELEGLSLAKMRPVTVTARDGLELVCYVSLPPGAAPDGGLRPATPLPTVMGVHGGPWSRDHWGYSPNHQWLANRGYAVVSVNYRGSSGFGKAFLNAANREWAGKMHDDLIDVAEWAVAEGIAARGRMAIIGGSYGGYATLVALTFTPDAFACGVDIVGPSNLLTLLRNVPEYWTPILPTLRDRVGDDTTDEGRRLLESRSPLTRVGDIRRPLLIGQGANDPRVKQQESDQIVAAMTERGIPVTYVLYPDEGHGFARPENRISFFAVAEAFLARELGGRCEPVGDDFLGSTITVPSGAEQIAGLTEALGSR